MADAITEAVKDIKFFLDRIEELTNRNKELEAELAEERRSREEAQAFAWTFSDALREIAVQPNDNALRPNFRIAMAALGQWQWPSALTEKKDG